MQRKNLDDERQEDQESHGAEQEEVMGQEQEDVAQRRVLGGQEEVNLDQGKKNQEAAGNKSCPGRQLKRDIN